MKPERWQRVEDVFNRAVALPAGERAAFVTTACDGDADLADEVASLLANTDDGDALATTIAAAAVAVRERALGAMVGPYRLVEVIGSGGMGTVYRAARDDGQFTRTVAIKVLQHDAVPAHAISRFRDERQILATLDHPGIVRLLDGGTTEAGTPYIVMELVDGTPLTDMRELPVRARLALVVRVAAALQYAHGRLVVHRDVKPSNILVDRDGAPRLLDFGIAKMLDGGPREADTRTGMSLLTPGYASPEQARGEAVTVATDVYSLGAVLFDLLVGRPPHELSEDALATLKSICELDPPRPSSLVPSLDRDLDSIVLKALQKRPERRYASAAAFAEDLERYLAGLPVMAREASRAYRARKLVARHLGKLVLALAIVVALAAATVFSVVQARRAERRNRDLVAERGQQELAAGHPDRALPFLVSALRAGDDSTALRFSLAEAMRPLSHEIARFALPAGILSIAWSPDGSRVALCGMGEVVRVFDRDGAPVTEIPVSTSRLLGCTFSADGRRFAGGDRDGRVFIWELPSGRLVRALGGEHPIAQIDVTTGVAFLGGDRIATAGRDRLARIWDATSGRTLVELHAPDEISSLAVSADETRLATGTARGDIFVWDAATGAQVAALHGHTGWVTVRFARDGRRLFSASWDRTARIWDIASGQAIAMTGHAGRVFGLDASADDGHLITGGDDNLPRIWNGTTGALEVELVGHAQAARAGGRFDATGTRAVTAGSDGTFRVWDARTGTEQLLVPAIPRGATGASSTTGPVDAQFSPDGTRLLTASGGGASLWRLDTLPLVAKIDAGGAARSVAWSPDERRLAVAGWRFAEIWDVASRTRVATLPGAKRNLEDVGWAPDGEHVVAAGEDGILRVYTAAGAIVREMAGHAGGVNRVSYSPDGRFILSASGDLTARVWDAETGAPVAKLEHPGRVMSAAWRRDGARIATGCSDGKVRVWDATTWALAAIFDGGAISILDVNFRPDGRELAASGHGGEVLVWDLADRTPRLAIAAHEAAVMTVTWSPDGELLATTPDEPIVKIWDARTGKLLGIRRGTGQVTSGVWNRAGTQLATSDQDGTIRIWDVHAADGDAGVDELLARDPYRLRDDRLELK